ncbi:type IV conjugative transfer system protein TraL (plasmid) [Vibrio sp. SS-MA-C1-2]|uniref:type IV conjugative transfer system protein TraL n=1 Tax=Vibrio sp. SS-MA-C1-2 TaxID=2908646 RepID=UPI001F36E18C|nr:type IV conjugative transfer system protein TraL [Vibrio sp. SS-MA-C1-2]UJF20355.1 type IV conjugative transfer system protein TraL [Vibrio sp. SS-MA-C1-2]
MSKLDINNDNRPELPNHHSYIPTRVNNRLSFLGMETDTLGILMLCMCLGHLSKNLVPMLFLGICLSYGYAKLKDRYPRGLFIHLAWWFGIYSPQPTRSRPNAYRRTFYK